MLCLADWESRWITSKKKSDYGVFKLTAGKFYADPEKDKGECSRNSFLLMYWINAQRCCCTVVGIQTSQDAKFYAVSSQFKEPFNNEGKTLVVQFTVKHEQGIDCGGGYLKVFPSGTSPKDLDGDSQYNIMFGASKVPKTND